MCHLPDVLPKPGAQKIQHPGIDSRAIFIGPCFTSSHSRFGYPYGSLPPFGAAADVCILGSPHQGGRWAAVSATHTCTGTLIPVWICSRVLHVCMALGAEKALWRKLRGAHFALRSVVPKMRRGRAGRVVPRVAIDS